MSRTTIEGDNVVALFGPRDFADISPNEYSRYELLNSETFDENGRHVQLLGEASARWLRRASTTKTAATMRGYTFNLGRFVDYLGHGAALDAVTVDDCEDWSVSLGLQSGSLKSAQAAPRSFFRYCVAKGLLDVSPWDSIPIPKPRPAAYRGLSPDVIARLLHCGDLRERTITLCGLHLGARCVEMSRMDRRDWDRAGGLIVLHGKGGKDRTLPVLTEMAWVLDVWYGGRRSGPLLPSADDPERSVSAQTVSAVFRRLARRAEVDATAHQLRHTFAHRMIESGVAPNLVKVAMGHSKLDTTGIYLEARADALRGLPELSFIAGGQAA